MVGQWLFFRSPRTSHQAWILSSMIITDRNVCYGSFTPISHYIGYFKVNIQSFSYGTFMNINIKFHYCPE